MQAKYHAWLHKRRYALPDDEMRQLELQLSECNRRNQSRVDRYHHLVATTMPSQAPGGEVDGGSRSDASMRGHVIRRGSLSVLPMDVRLRILDFIAVVESAYVEDLVGLMAVAASLDASLALHCVSASRRQSTTPPSTVKDRMLSPRPQVHHNNISSGVTPPAAAVLATDAVGPGGGGGVSGGASPLPSNTPLLLSPKASAAAATTPHPAIEILDALERELRDLYGDRLVKACLEWVVNVGALSSRTFTANALPQSRRSSSYGSVGLLQGGQSPPPAGLSSLSNGIETLLEPPGTPNPSTSKKVGGAQRLSFAPPSSTTGGGGGGVGAGIPCGGDSTPSLGLSSVQHHAGASSVESAYFVQHRWLLSMIRRGASLIHKQRVLVERMQAWQTFRDKMLDTTCAQLRYSFRDDTAAWHDVLSEWLAAAEAPVVTSSGPAPMVPCEFAVQAREGAAVLLRMALDELSSYRRRTTAVEYIGDPKLTLDDVRNMFFEVSLKPFDDGAVTESYLQSVTLRQAMTLGLTEIAWVRGYAWEDRSAPGDDEDDGGDDDLSVRNLQATAPATATETHQTMPPDGSPSRRGARSLCSLARSERILQMLGSLGVDDTVRRQYDELEAERLMLESQEAALRKRAFVVAVDGMSQRLWKSTETFKPRWTHAFRGCEICNRTPIVHVGLRKENAAVATDIVLCHECFVELYGTEGSIPNRMYSWYLVEDLIGSGATSAD